MGKEHGDGMSVITRALVFIIYFLLVCFGYMREIWDEIGVYFGRPAVSRSPPPGYPPVLSRIETFFVRRLYARLAGSFNRPIASCASARVDVIERVREGDPVYSLKFVPTGRVINCINLASYNYLGFSQNCGPVNESVIHLTRQTCISQCAPGLGSGRLHVHRELEKTIASFLGKEDALVWGMGWGVNATGIASLAGRGTLIISDSLNHASLVVGCRASGGVVRVFQHNNVKDLEKVVRNAIVSGQPLTHRPWRKIIILVEGVYSMEGEVPPLPEIVALKKKYKCYLYVDEAHSIGASGETGRGVCERLGVSTTDVDVLMGTFTKSFGAAGGYMASSHEVIQYIRATSFAMYYDAAMPLPVAQQALAALQEMRQPQGLQRIKTLNENSQYFRKRLMEMGFQILGDIQCPIIPLMMYHPVKLYIFSQLCLEKGIAIAVVSFPATPLLLSRARFCLSSGHSREELEYVLSVLDELGDVLSLKYDRKGWDQIRAILWN
jgi:serine palmitoyltransferase